MNGPLISVIVPVHNGDRFLAQALESIRAQAYAPIEIVVVNDGSTDRTLEVAAAFSDVRCISQPHSGIGVAFNSAIAIANGDWFAFLDHDDLWTPDKLHQQAQALLDDVTLDAVFGASEQFFERPELAETLRLDEDRRRLAAPLLSTMLIRREAFFRVGLFNPALRLATAMEWQQRRVADPRHRAVSLQTVVHRRRIHGDNNSLQQKSRMHAEYFDLIRQSLRRNPSTEV